MPCHAIKILGLALTPMPVVNCNESQVHHVSKNIHLNHLLILLVRDKKRHGDKEIKNLPLVILKLYGGKHGRMRSVDPPIFEI